MPLRDHFRPPPADRRSWEGVHGGWPMMIVQGIGGRLPDRYVAEPQVHPGTAIERDTATDGDLSESDEYEVRVYDARAGRRLVAAVELVSPSNKDRPEHRRAFVGKCAALLRQGVCVSIVDLVTSRAHNLYRGLLELLGQADPAQGDPPPPIYAASCRLAKPGDAWVLEAWAHPLALGEPLPTLPLWLAADLAVPLELEQSYEETCRILRIL